MSFRKKDPGERHLTFEERLPIGIVDLMPRNRKGKIIPPDYCSGFQPLPRMKVKTYERFSEMVSQALGEAVAFKKAYPELPDELDSRPIEEGEPGYTFDNLLEILLEEERRSSKFYRILGFVGLR